MIALALAATTTLARQEQLAGLVVRGRAGSRSGTPTEVLDRRFAEGEISAEDYRERREVVANGARRGRGAAGDNERDVVSKATGGKRAMKKAIVGVVAVGLIITMAAKCRQMMSGQCRGGEAGGMREHCKEMMGAHKADGEIAETRNEGEQEAPQFVGSGEAVGV